MNSCSNLRAAIGRWARWQHHLAPTVSAAEPDRAGPRSWLPVVVLGMGAGCVSPLQPVLLNMMQVAHRLSMAEVGLAATAEALGMALATTLAALLLPLRGLRRLARGAVLAMLAANIATMLVTGLAAVACRLLNGLGCGILLWMLVGMVTQTPAPARTYAIYITGQALLGLALSRVLTATGLAQGAHGAGYVVLLAVDVTLLAMAAIMPDRIGPASRDAARTRGVMRGLPLPMPCLALAAIVAYFAGILGLWIYILPLLRELGHPVAHAMWAVRMVIGGQVVGGVAAFALATRVSPLAVWGLGAVAALSAIHVIAATTTLSPLLMAAAVIGFVGMFVPPFQMPVLLRLDLTRRAPMLLAAAQLSGVSLGPFLASRVVTGQSVQAVLRLSTALLEMSIALIALVWLALANQARFLR